jgi:hypothetical protein
MRGGLRWPPRFELATLATRSALGYQRDNLEEGKRLHGLARCC